MKLGKTGGTGALLIYVEVAVSCVMLKDSVIGKLLNRLMEVPEADIPGVLSENRLGISDALEFAIAASAIKHTMPGDINYTTEKEVLALMNSDGSGRVQR